MKLVSFVVRYKFYTYLMILVGKLLFDFLCDGFVLTCKTAMRDIVMAFFEFVGIVSLAEASLNAIKRRTEKSAP